MATATGPASRRWKLGGGLVVASVAVIALADLLIWQVHPPYGVEALADEPAHAAIGILALAAVGISFSAPVVLAVLGGSLLIDLDHIPDLLGSQVLEHGVPRPYTHSLGTILLVLAVALLLRDRGHRRLALVVAVALCLHFLRDMAEPGGPGVSLLWPVSDRAVTIGYWWWAGVVAVLAVLALARRAGGRGAISRLNSRRSRRPPSGGDAASSSELPAAR